MGDLYNTMTLEQKINYLQPSPKSDDEPTQLFKSELTGTETNMKSTALTFAVALAVRQVAGHATFQALWVDGTDFISAL